MTVLSLKSVFKPVFSMGLSLKNPQAEVFPETQPLTKFKEIVLIFNRIHHASLIAAVMYAIAMRERGDNVTMIDVRDDFYLSGADQYVWIDTQTLGTNAEIPKEIRRSSVYINTEPVDMTDVFVDTPTEFLRPTVVDTVYDRLRTSGVLTEHQKSVYNRIRLLARAFEEKMNDATNCCAYYDVIDHAFEYYLNHTSEDFTERMLEPSPDKVRLFLAKQKEITSVTRRRLSTTTLQGQSVYMVTDTDKSVYGTLRRIRITGNNYVHLSVGTHGKFIQTSLVKMPNEKWVHKLNVLERQ